MKLVVGLGNPGVKYKNNRHNVGHMFINYLISELTGSRAAEFKFFKTDCFMNQSGLFVKKLIASYLLPIASIFIVHDDLDIPLGKFKIQFANGPKDHNGLASIEEELGTNEFWRIRIGIDNRSPDNRTNGEDYVLQDFTDDEEKTLNEVYKQIMERVAKLQTQNNKI